MEEEKKKRVKLKNKDSQSTESSSFLKQNESQTKNKNQKDILSSKNKNKNKKLDAALFNKNQTKLIENESQNQELVGEGDFEKVNETLNTELNRELEQSQNLIEKSDIGNNKDCVTIETTIEIKPEVIENNGVTEFKKHEEKTDRKKGKGDKERSEPIIELNIKKQIEESAKEAEEIAETNKEEIAPTVDKQIVVAEKEVKKKSSKLSKYFYAICLIVNIVSFTIFLSINSQTKVPFAELMQSKSIWWLLIAFLCFGAIMFVEAVRYYILIFKSTKKSRPLVSYNTATIGKFYDFITPLSTGGQAHQIIYLSKSKIENSLATSVPITKYVFNQFCYLLVVVALFTLSGQQALIGDFGAKFVGVAAYIGLAFQFLLLVIVFTFSVSKKIAPACTIGVLKLARKMHIIKDYKEVYIKVLRFVHEYQISMRKFFTDFFNFFVMFISSVLLILIRCLVPFFIYCAFFGFDASQIIPICARILMCELAMGIWILPGNVPFADVAFMALFKSVFINGTLFWALLFWRIISYYLYILQGFILIPIKNYRQKRALANRHATK